MPSLFMSIVIPIRIVALFRFINTPHKSPLFGVYQQKNKYHQFKFVLMVIFLTVKQWIWRLKRAYAVDVGKSCDGTKQVHEDDTQLEQKYDLGGDPYAVDATYFNGISKDGTAITFGLARRQENVCDALACIKVNGEEYLSPKFPDTHLQQDKCDNGEFSVHGIKIESFMPMRTWKLSYNGEMKSRCDPEKTVKVKAELTWSALFAPFNYNYQMSPIGLANDLAKEPWTRDYFRLIKKLHQTHYSQVGSLEGNVTIDGKEHVLKMPCFRDRTFGKMHDWRNFHRYVFHTLYLENGDCIEVGSVSQPLLGSHLTMGFMCRKSDQAVFPVKISDFKLYQHGESEITPKDYGFRFKADGKYYTVQVTVDDEYVYYIGKNRESKIYKQWQTVNVNGVKGRGLGQWQYNNVQASNTVK